MAGNSGTALIGGSVSEAALRGRLGRGITSATVSAFLILLMAFAAPFKPFTSLRVVVLRARLSEGGGDSEVSDADSFGRVALRVLEVLEDVLDSCDCDFATTVARDVVREGALGLLASMEACERLRVGMWISRWGDDWQATA